jgi:acetyl esterase/lipase
MSRNFCCHASSIRRRNAVQRRTSFVAVRTLADALTMFRMELRHSALAFVLASAILLPASAQHTVLPLWPHATPEPAQTTEPEKDVTTPDMLLISGHRTARITNVVNPTLTVYSPSGRQDNNGAAALVFPGGGYVRLAWDGEGIDTCRWLNSLGMTCLLVKYRVPEKAHYPDSFADLEDAQQAMRLARAHAADWHLDPNRIGVVGFSAGGHLAVVLSTHSDDAHVQSTPAAPDVNAKIDARPDFAILGYPAYLALSPAKEKLDPALTPGPLTPPTFLVQAENDHAYIDGSLFYYRALKNARIPAEMHLYATGGHGFGLHPVGKPEEHWTQTAATWLRSIGIIPALTLSANDSDTGPSNNPPCTIPPATQTAAKGHPDPTTNSQQTDPACW